MPYIIRQINWSILKEWEEKKKKQNTLFQFLWIKKKGNGEMCHKISNQKVQKFTYDKYRYKCNKGYQKAEDKSLLPRNSNLFPFNLMKSDLSVNKYAVDSSFKQIGNGFRFCIFDQN